MTIISTDGEVVCWFVFLVTLTWLGGQALLRYAAERYGGDSLRADYESEPRPRFAAPAWLFAPAWTVLYALLCVVGYRARTRCGAWEDGGAAPLSLFVCDLALLAVWPAIYSGARRKRLGIMIQVLALGTSIALCVLAWGCDILSGVLMLPLCVWLTYALILACAIERLRAGMTSGMLGAQTPSSASASHNQKDRAARRHDHGQQAPRAATSVHSVLIPHHKKPPAHLNHANTNFDNLSLTVV